MGEGVDWAEWVSDVVLRFVLWKREKGEERILRNNGIIMS